VYEIDRRDSVAPFEGIPLPDAGPAATVALASEHSVVLGYRAASGFGTTVVLTFEGVVAHYFGAPNDEALTGHPLSPRGLAPYGVYLVQESSWVRAIDRLTAVPHAASETRARRHFVLTFQDSTFECVAAEIQIETAPITTAPADAAARKFRSLIRSA
jgi:hypothetical protein